MALTRQGRRFPQSRAYSDIVTPMKQAGLPLLAKKLFDRTVALGGLVVTAPIVATAAVLVRATMGGPVFFHQTRPGRNGVPFNIVKMRTMTSERDAAGRLLPDEKRLTKLGKFLRATSIDELPQLWNVLRGDLSLVGPRPLLMQYLPLYNQTQARRHDVLPGMTGWAQIHGRNALSWEERFALDVWYVDHWSLALDAKILAGTFTSVLKRQGIAREGHATMPNFTGSRAASMMLN
jgi:lipopolysaccharide/colanic/teichoic acid biosynthesis glycosyltransferase